jgi:hypothetical protein
MVWNHDEVPITKALNSVSLMHPDIQRKLPGYENQITPLSEHLFSVLRDPLREYLPDDVLYDETFDWFEYLLALIHCDLTISPEKLAVWKGTENWRIWSPPGRFVWNGGLSGTVTVQQKAELKKGQSYPVHIAGLPQAGFFDHPERYLDLKRGLDASVAKMALRW